jgi:hypothetical protein
MAKLELTCLRFAFTSSVDSQATITVAKSPHQQAGSECKRLWLLKNSIFQKSARILGIENV